MSTPEVSKKLGRSGKGVSEREEGVGSLDSPPSLTPYFLHLLAVSFPWRAFVGNALRRLI